MPYTSKSSKSKTPPASPEMPAPPSGMAMEGMTPEEIAALKEGGYTAFDDGMMIPPMPKPGAANQTGGAPMQDDIRSDIFRQLYRAGKRSGNDALMNIGRPPVPEAGPPMPVPPWQQPQEEPFFLSAPPTPAPQYTQADVPQGPGPGMGQMQQRFPRAASLLGRAMPQRPQRGMGY